MPKLRSRSKTEWYKYVKQENTQYNTICRKCVYDCKQDYRSKMTCGKYKRKK